MQLTDYFHRILIPKLLIMLLYVPILGNFVMQLTMLFGIELNDKEFKVETILTIQLLSPFVFIVFYLLIKYLL